MKQIIHKKFYVSYIIAFEMVAVNASYYEENTCHQQSTCYETVQRFEISQGETFSNSISLILMRQYYTSAAIQISAVFGTP